MKTLAEQIKEIKNQDEIVSLRDSYGVSWTEKAKFVFGAVTNEAWESERIEVVRQK